MPTAAQSSHAEWVLVAIGFIGLLQVGGLAYSAGIKKSISDLRSAIQNTRETYVTQASCLELHRHLAHELENVWGPTAIAGMREKQNELDRRLTALETAVHMQKGQVRT